MSCEPGVRALVCDLLGEDWDEGERRPEVAEALARCPRGQVMAARQGGCDVAVGVLEDGRPFVLPDRCPHDGGRLSDGFIERGRLVCARHGWELDPETGERVWPAPARPRCAERA
ncbi:MAG TPA: Rieske (2Fe-2S) protein [Kofleriaceae bacterium]|nr:Rieske (2Fe-2S) protein [Kofleriaceae bacterium]